MRANETVRKPLLQSLVPILPVRDMARSVAFYQRLGFSCEPYEDGQHYAFLTMGDVSAHLRLGGPKEFASNPGGVYLYVEDVEAFFKLVTSAGISTLDAPEDKPWGMREFAVSDPDETLLRIGERSGSL